MSPNGRLLASGDYLGKVLLWDLSAYADIRDHVTELACERAGRGFTQDEWIRHVEPNLEFQPTCP